MSKNANQSKNNTRFIYSRSLKEKIPCTEEQFQDFYRMAGAIRKKEQYHHRCKCPKQFIWACDGDCENCEHHLGYKELSLEAPNTETGDSFMDMLPDENVSMEQVYEDRLLLEQLSSVFVNLTRTPTVLSPCGWLTTKSPTVPLLRLWAVSSAPSPIR